MNSHRRRLFSAAAFGAPALIPGVGPPNLIATGLAVRGRAT
jgi:hypothetical protein